MVEPSPEHDLLAHEVVDAAFSVHRTLGPGLLESAYEQFMAYEFEARAISFRRQVILPIAYRGYTIETGYRMDMIVGGLIVVEIKSVEKLLPIHEAQLHTYLKLSGFHLGLLINFHVPLLKYGIKRRIWSH